MLKIISIILLFSGLVQAEAHHKGTLSGITVGARYSSVLEKRGLILYNDFQIDPAITIFMFDDRLEFWGDTLSYHDFIYEDKIRLRTRLSSVSDDPLFPAYNSIRESRPNRPTTYEFINSVEMFFPGYNDNYQYELDITWAKDISRHYGNYLNALAKIKLTEFHSSLLNKRVEPNLVLGAGIGDKAHNKFFYGPDDEATGLTNYSYGIWLAFPDDADRFFPIVQLTYFSVTGDHRQAAYAKDYNQGWLASVIYTFRVFN